MFLELFISSSQFGSILPFNFGTSSHTDVSNFASIISNALFKYQLIVSEVMLSHSCSLFAKYEYQKLYHFGTLCGSLVNDWRNVCNHRLKIRNCSKDKRSLCSTYLSNTNALSTLVMSSSAPPNRIPSSHLANDLKTCCKISQFFWVKTL